MMRTTIVTLLVIVLAPAAAHAQVTFPADSAYRPLRCGNAVMTDALADTSGFLDERDVVGDPAGPAGFRASDATNLYLRIRLEKDAAQGAVLRSFAWGMEFDLDGDRRDYELLIVAEGIAGSVSIFRNTTVTVNNAPSDPADIPAAQSYPYAMNGRSVQASDTSFGGSADFFLDFAVPWSDLIPLGLDHDTPTRVWVGSSSQINTLDGDLACHDGAGGAATLDGTASDETTGDPNDPGGGGGTGRLEGGGGCSTTNGSGVLALIVVLGLLVPRGNRRAR